MTNFATNAASMLKDLYSVSNFGVEAVFSPLEGEDVDLTVIVRKQTDAEPSANVFQAAVPQTIIRYQRADIDRKVVKGETFTAGSTVYTVRTMGPYPESWTDFEGRASVTEG